MNKQIQGGLRPLKKDRRDFSYTKKFGIVSLPTQNFRVGAPLEIKEQFSSDMCTAFASTGLSELQEGVILSPEWQFAKIKQMEGNWQAWGADLRTTCKSLVKYGSLPKDKAEFNLKFKDRNFLANWENWDKTKYGNGFELEMIARKHRKQSYFAIDTSGYTDLFDAMRGALWQQKEYKRGILTGIMWRTVWNNLKDGIIPIQNGGGEFGHSFYFIGQKYIDNVLYLEAITSNGLDMGNKGSYYFPREVVNQECIYGNYIFVDMPPEQAKVEVWSNYQVFLDRIKKLLTALLQ